MPHLRFPSGEYVYWTRLDEHERIKGELLPVVIDKMKNGCIENPFKTCTMKTTITHNYKLLNREQLQKVLFEPLRKMFSEIDDSYIKNMDIYKTCVTTQWFNFYEKGDFQEVHSHLQNDNQMQEVIIDGKFCKEVFSAVYILHDKSTENSLVFKGGDIVFDTSKQSDIQEGCVLLFPTSLKHEVRPVVVPGRITFAFNVAYHFSEM